MSAGVSKVATCLLALTIEPGKPGNPGLPAGPGEPG